MKHFYEKDIFISKDIATKINKACSLSYPEDWFSEHETPYTITVGFADGIIMDIRCCGSQDGPSWCESILWAPTENGGLYEVGCSNGVFDSILGKWEMIAPDTKNEYIVNVKIEEEEVTPSNNVNTKHFNEMILHSAKKNESAYVSIDTPNGQFRIYSEQEDGYHGAFITFIRDGQTVEQDICMAELNPDNPKEFSVKVWSEPRSEEYQEDIKFGQYIEPRCPYCGNYGVEEVDEFTPARDCMAKEIKFLCPKCENDFLFDTKDGSYTTRNRVPLKPFEEKEKEQE